MMVNMLKVGTDETITLMNDGEYIFEVDNYNIDDGEYIGRWDKTIRMMMLSMLKEGTGDYYNADDGEYVWGRDR